MYQRGAKLDKWAYGMKWFKMIFEAAKYLHGGEDVEAWTAGVSFLAFIASSALEDLFSVNITNGSLGKFTYWISFRPV